MPDETERKRELDAERPRGEGRPAGDQAETASKPEPGSGATTPGGLGALRPKTIAGAVAIAGVATVILQGLTGASWILALLGGVGTAIAVSSLSLDS